MAADTGNDEQNFWMKFYRKLLNFNLMKRKKFRIKKIFFNSKAILLLIFPSQTEKKNEMCIKLLREVNVHTLRNVKYKIVLIASRNSSQVAHFLDKCNTNFESSQQQQQHLNEKMIERSKSISHISCDRYISNNRTISNTPNRSRTHSISNLSHSMSTKFFSDLSFKDFTW